jgi:hypothetical protein
LDPDSVSSRQRSGNRIDWWCKEPEYRVAFREVVHPTRESSDRALPGKSMKRKAHRLAAAKVEEVPRNDDRTIPLASDSSKYFRVNTLCQFS